MTFRSSVTLAIRRWSLAAVRIVRRHVSLISPPRSPWHRRRPFGEAGPLGGLVGGNLFPKTLLEHFGKAMMKMKNFAAKEEENRFDCVFAITLPFPSFSAG
jgi:hypothetical protein